MPEHVPGWWPYQGEFPQWRAHKDEDGLLYVRLPGADPLVIVRTGDAARLRAEVIRKTSEPAQQQQPGELCLPPDAAEGPGHPSRRCRARPAERQGRQSRRQGVYWPSPRLRVERPHPRRSGRISRCRPARRFNGSRR
jgi:hypothetical protein